MADLRELAGACFLVVVIGTVVFVPVGWAIVLGIDWAYSVTIKGQPDKQKHGLVQKKSLLPSTFEQVRFKQ